MTEASEKRNSTVDVVKGLAILMVIFTHYAWSAEQRKYLIFPYAVNMAVPIFMVISGYVGSISFHKNGIKSFSEAYEGRNILRKAIRYSIPFLIAVIWQIVDPNIVIKADGLLNKLRWFLNGTAGSGSYYFPILIQLIFTFPIIYFIIERKGKKGLWICLIINAAYELLKWSYGMTEECYRMLLFRYIFVIAAGVYAYKYSLNLFVSIAMTAIGGAFLWVTNYEIYTPRIITSWTTTCFIATMWIVPITLWIIKKVHVHFPPLELIGRASYNIFLVQMVYYHSYRIKVVSLFRQWRTGFIAGFVICVSVGLVFYLVESRITKAIVKVTVGQMAKVRK